MILTLTPNPALDVTYEVDRTRIHAEHRVRAVRTAPGGKGVNVARVLTQLATGAVCAGPLGGATGDRLRDLLAAEAPTLRQAWTPIDAATRRTITVVDPDGATGFNEPGPVLTVAESRALGADLAALLAGADPLIDAVTISGSLPPGIEGAEPAELVGLCRARDRPVLVDTSGPALREAARAGATVLKPNAAEALAVTGADTPLAAAAELAALGAGYVVCSLGPDGMLGLDRGGGRTRAWRARLPEPVRGNPTGAGDSVVAVLASMLLTGRDDLPGVLRRAVAVSAGAVTRPVAGEIDPELAAELEPTVTVEEIPCP